MQSLGITDSHYMRTRGAARTGAAPRDLDPAVSPTLTVGATHQVAYYLYYNADIGLTYESKPRDLSASSDASWLTRHSTSGWYVSWQGAALSWGSTKQDCIALSSCEAEIVALSECAKDVIYYRKKLNGIDESYVSGPTPTSTDNKAAHDLS